MHWLILISEIKERNPPSVYRLCCCQRSIFSFSFPCPALRMFALRSFHTYLRSILLAPGHLPSAVQFCFATSVTWYSYGINRRASKKAHVVAFCIQGWIPALWLDFFNLHMMQLNALTCRCLTVTLQHYIKRWLRCWWWVEESNQGRWSQFSWFTP